MRTGSCLIPVLRGIFYFSSGSVGTVVGVDRIRGISNGSLLEGLKTDFYNPRGRRKYTLPCFVCFLTTLTTVVCCASPLIGRGRVSHLASLLPYQYSMLTNFQGVLLKTRSKYVVPHVYSRILKEGEDTRRARRSLVKMARP
jgi:hypothetical protein